jgi:hypothetical protein
MLVIGLPIFHALVHRIAIASNVDARLVKSLLGRSGWHHLKVVESGFEDYDPYSVDVSTGQPV